MKEHDGCVGCRYENFTETSSYCQGCKQNAVDKYTKMTNADRIRAMSDEELLDFLCSIETYDQGSVKTIEGSIAMCSVSEVEKWLQSEVEEKTWKY